MIDRFDHAVIAVPDLEAAIASYRELGFDAVRGGRHEGLGTENGIIRFGLDYLELIAIYDEDAARQANPARRALVDLLARGSGLATYALASIQLDALAQRFRERDPDSPGPVAAQRRRPDGVLLSWRILTPGGVAVRRPWPFFIQWDLPDTQRLAIERVGQHPNGITGVRGVAVVVADLEAAIELYQHRLGLGCGPVTERPSWGARAVVVKVGSFSIELLSPNGPGAAEQALSKQGEGLFEIALRSADLGRTRDYLGRVGGIDAVSAGLTALAPLKTFGPRITIG